MYNNKMEEEALLFSELYFPVYFTKKNHSEKMSCIESNEKKYHHFQPMNAERD